MSNTQSNCRFLAKHHIRQAAEFDVVIKRGKRFSEACFAFCYLKTEKAYPRLGLMINKRNCALAVDRNRLKRVIREQFRLKQHALPTVDMVVMLKSSPKNMSDQELIQCLEKLFSRIEPVVNSLI